jgi:hypothetical protein
VRSGISHGFCVKLCAGGHFFDDLFEMQRSSPSVFGEIEAGLLKNCYSACILGLDLDWVA